MSSCNANLYVGMFQLKVSARSNYRSSPLRYLQSIISRVADVKQDILIFSGILRNVRVGSGSDALRGAQHAFSVPLLPKRMQVGPVAVEHVYAVVPFVCPQHTKHMLYLTTDKHQIVIQVFLDITNTVDSSLFLKCISY